MHDIIIKVLTKELNYSNHVAIKTTEDLLNMDGQLHEALALWVKKRTISNLAVQGFSVKWLMNEKGMTYPAALIALDWLLNEPDVAKKEMSKETTR